jgi:hypothetical protein
MSSVVFVSALSIVFLSLGLANIFIYRDNNTPCGIGGQPSLDIWCYGSGIAYTTIGGLLVVSALLAIFLDVVIVGVITLILGGGFTISWTIVGAISWLRFGLDCSSINNPLFSISSATILTFFSVIPLSIALIPIIIENM